MSSPIRSAALVLALFALLVGLSGCTGYSAGQGNDLVLDALHRDLYVKSVDNPTMRAELESRLRSVLRDEMTRRGHIAWSDPDQATAYVTVRVEQFTSTTSITDKYDKSLLLSATVTLSAAVHAAGSGDVIWNSGDVSASRNFLTGDRASAEEKVIDLAVRRLVDRMHQNF